jgi:hypothetical protein
MNRKKNNAEQIAHCLVNMIDDQFGEDKKKLEKEIDDHRKTKEGLHAAQFLLKKQKEDITARQEIITDLEK